MNNYYNLYIMTKTKFYLVKYLSSLAFSTTSVVNTNLKKQKQTHKHKLTKKTYNKIIGPAVLFFFLMIKFKKQSYSYLPLFKNPNSPLNFTSSSSSFSLESDRNKKSAAISDTNSKFKSAAGIGTTEQVNNVPALLQQDNENLKKLELNNLVFLKKKGSQKANPSVVSYSFSSNNFNSIEAQMAAGDMDKFNANEFSLAVKKAGLPVKLTSLPETVDKPATGQKQQLSEQQLRWQQVSGKIYSRWCASLSEFNLNKMDSNNLYKLLLFFFKSMYSLISKPVFINTPDKIKIQLFYFVCIPKILTNMPNSIESNLVDSKSSEGFVETYSGEASGEASIDKHAVQQELDEGIFSLFKENQKVKYLRKIRKFNSRFGGQNKFAAAKFNLIQLSNSKTSLAEIYPDKFKKICNLLSFIFKKSVEFDLIRLHQPYLDNNILVNFLSLIINKKNIGAVIQRLYNSNIIKSGKAKNYNSSLDVKSVLYNYGLADTNGNSAEIAAADIEAYLSGLNIKISGRLMREPIIPRITTKKFDKGFTAKGKVNYSDVARFTHKNRKGAFTITVKSGQKFY